ncbi:hypothetical protein J5N97_015244 [Dioscorea zingiberensis]|uniref:tRNA synthetases class I catalytic domain-containing protein n=1 Tax=Dioscorea zingiberensis TaxID=325984 RepID=A0A9D5HKA3_9LILI|nr:hypothetical protein J5N97_015244 [Dioscorea zingiberensis]
MGPPELQIFSSINKKKEVFKPMIDGEVGMYVCGVTPYDFSHIGHAFDVLHRYLIHLGYRVKYSRNFTDIDDKIIKRANESGDEALDLSARFNQAFLEDMAELQCAPPTHEPQVSDRIDQIKDMITKKMFTSHLSGRKLDDNRAGGGGWVSIDLRNRNPADFTLWKVRCLTDNNFFTIRDVRIAGALVTTLWRHGDSFLMCTHYRTDVNYSDRQVDNASDRVYYIYQGKKQQQALIHTLIALEKEVKDVLQQLRAKALKRAGLTEEQVQHQIEEITLARKNKKYEKSDNIRVELYAKGVALIYG